MSFPANAVPAVSRQHMRTQAGPPWRVRAVDCWSEKPIVVASFGFAPTGTHPEGPTTGVPRRCRFGGRLPGGRLPSHHSGPRLSTATNGATRASPAHAVLAMDCRAVERPRVPRAVAHPSGPPMPPGQSINCQRLVLRSGARCSSYFGGGAQAVLDGGHLIFRLLRNERRRPQGLPSIVLPCRVGLAGTNAGNFRGEPAARLPAGSDLHVRPSMWRRLNRAPAQISVPTHIFSGEALGPSVKIWPRSCSFGESVQCSAMSADFGRIWPMLERHLPNSGKPRPIVWRFRLVRATTAISWAMTNQTWLHRPLLERLRPISGELARIWSEFGQCWPTLRSLGACEMSDRYFLVENCAARYRLQV